MLGRPHDDRARRYVRHPGRLHGALTMSKVEIALASLLLCGSCVALACSGAAKQQKIGDDARVLTPVPACVVPLPARQTQSGTLRNLHEEQYWSVVFPAFDTKTKT